MPCVLQQRKVALIGSFRQYYNEILLIYKAIIEAGHKVTSPRGSSIIENGIDFVRFTSDNESHDDYAVQSIALHRIFCADIVYVVAPNGYIGKTTCYEIGRLVQCMRPVYFSEIPSDLPIRLQQEKILHVNDFIHLLSDSRWHPLPLYCETHHEFDYLEKDLLEGKYRDV